MKPCELCGWNPTVARNTAIGHNFTFLMCPNTRCPRFNKWVSEKEWEEGIPESFFNDMILSSPTLIGLALLSLALTLIVIFAWMEWI